MTMTPPTTSAYPGHWELVRKILDEVDARGCRENHQRACDFVAAHVAACVERACAGLMEELAAIFNECPISRLQENHNKSALEVVRKQVDAVFIKEQEVHDLRATLAAREIAEADDRELCSRMANILGDGSAARKALDRLDELERDGYQGRIVARPAQWVVVRSAARTADAAKPARGI